MFDRGISYEGDLLDLPRSVTLWRRPARWYNYKSTRLGKAGKRQAVSSRPTLWPMKFGRPLSSKGLLNAKRLWRPGGG